MRVLVFDTETTGLPHTKIINPDTLHLWPYVVQMSYIIYDTDTMTIVEIFNYIVKMEPNIIIPEDSIQIHGITNEKSQKDGIKITKILNNFFIHLKTVDLLVGHNVTFDINIIKIELLRNIYNNVSISENDLKKCKHNLHLLTNFKNICCTLKDSIKICDIKAIDKSGNSYLKYPKLVELHQKLFETIPNNLHNSLNDILITLRCFAKLKYDIDVNNTCKKFMIVAKQMRLL